jgi:hypothetical protein
MRLARRTKANLNGDRYDSSEAEGDADEDDDEVAAKPGMSPFPCSTPFSHH